MYALLHCKSVYSLGDGTASVPDLVERAARLGYRACALTDVESLAGQIELHHAARMHGLHAITGVELRGGFSLSHPGSLQGRLVLLARDVRGYESLCRIITARRCASFESTPDPLHCLDAFPSGLFYLSDDPEVVRRLLSGGVAAVDIRLLRPVPAPDGGSPVASVADPDVVMLEPVDRELRGLLGAMRGQRPFDRDADDQHDGRVLPMVEELRARFATRPELLSETLRLASECSLDLTQPVQPLPTGDHFDTESALEALTSSCRAALQVRCGRDPVRIERLAQELSAVARAGVAAYFLAVAEIAVAARERGIAYVARGSAPGSLVCYLLGVTSIEPVAHGLSFERFLHPQTHRMPHLDLDVAADRRDELLQWITRRFGESRVAQVAAYQTFGRRAAFREGLRALGMERAAIDRFIQAFPGADREQDAVPLPLELLPADLHESIPLIERMIGMPRNVVVRPGGVVITEARVDAHAPLERAPGGVVTQYDMTALTRLGLIKLDLVGSAALAAQAETIRLIAREVEMPDGDPATVAALRDGNTIGCTEIETPVMRSVLKRLPVRGMVDLRAALALVRPGPGADEAKEQFLRRANGETSRQPPHPRLADRLRETHGMLLFDEDLMAAISGLTGWTSSMADAARVLLVESSPQSPALLSLKRRFLVAASHSGVARGDGERVWQLLERFAGRSLSKAHAASRARLAWEAAYLKTHHPLEFGCGILNHYDGHYPLRAVASELIRCGVSLRPPHVNRSATPHQLEDGAVRLGLCAVKFLSARHREWLLEARPFSDLRDLLSRVPLSLAELESLILSGACDDLAPLARDAYPFPHEELLTRWKRVPGVAGLDGFVARNARGRFAQTHRALTRIRNELRFLGMHVSDHPMRLLRPEAEQAGCITTREAIDKAGQTVRLAGMAIASRKQADRQGRPVQFLTLEDEEGLLEAVVPAEARVALRDPQLAAGPLTVRGRVEGERGVLQLRVAEAEPFQARPDGSRIAEPV